MLKCVQPYQLRREVQSWQEQRIRNSLQHSALAFSISPQRLLHRCVRERAHDRVARGVGVQIVGAQLFAQESGRIGHRRRIVEIDVLLGRGVFLHPVVDRLDARHRPLQRLGHAVRRGVIRADREDAREDDADAVRLADLRHRRQVAFNLLVGHRTGVARNVVRAGQDHHDLGLQIDDVRPEADEHLRRGLSADTAADVDGLPVKNVP